MPIANIDPVPADVERAAADALVRGLSVRFVPRDPQAGGPLISSSSGPPEPLGVKTIVVKQGHGYVLVLAPYAERFSWAKLRHAMRVNRTSLPDADEAYEATGYVRGTITPLGARGAFPVYADARIAGHPIILGSGSPDYAAWTDADPLISAYGAQVVDLTIDE